MANYNFRQFQILFRARLKVQRILPYLEEGKPILDIGAGNGGVDFMLSNKHDLAVHPIDVVNKSRFQSIQPQIFNGEVLPFEANTFHTVLLLTVLHHTTNPEALVAEAKRVATHQVIIMEDIYSNTLQERLTKFMDSIVNWEFQGHPHNNRTDEGWRRLFDKLDLLIAESVYHRVGMIFRQVTYVLKKEKGRS